PDGQFRLKLLGDAGLSKWAHEFLPANPDYLEKRAQARNREVERFLWGPTAVKLDAAGSLYISTAAGIASRSIADRIKRHGGGGQEECRRRPHGQRGGIRRVYACGRGRLDSLDDRAARTSHLRLQPPGGSPDRATRARFSPGHGPMAGVWGCLPPLGYDLR